MVNQYKEKIRRFDFTVKIVILDDEPEFSKILDKKIKAYCARKDLLYDCQIFSSSKTLLEDDLSSIQVAFLDIDMPEFNGLDRWYPHRPGKDGVEVLPPKTEKSTLSVVRVCSSHLLLLNRKDTFHSFQYYFHQSYYIVILQGLDLRF